MKVPFAHEVDESATGERCICGNSASHKVGEEIPIWPERPPRHNFTTYLCCICFGALFGLLAQEWCRSAA